VNSYAHDESGITTEEAGAVTQMSDKRARKAAGLATEMETRETVRTNGVPGTGTAIACWGSAKGVCFEVAEELGLRAVQPVVLSPFPKGQLTHALEGARRLVVVEENATGQFAALLRFHGITPDATILRYDGRPFSPDTLMPRVRDVIA
jgi:2-oxoglutarate ferredoxin oxidoreductase subunit alpha